MSKDRRDTCARRVTPYLSSCCLISFCALQLQFNLATVPAQLGANGIVTTNFGTANAPVDIVSILANQLGVGIQILSIVSALDLRDGELFTPTAPVWQGNGATLPFASTIQDLTTGLFTQRAGLEPPLISTLSVSMPVSSSLWIRAITWKLPDIKAGILPDAALRAENRH
jgi:hypothetical protein